MNDFLKEVIQQLELYFAAKLKEFTIPLEIKTSKFYYEVYQKLLLVNYGEKITYKQLAHQLNTKAYQAIGSAMNKNPLLIFIPCHRVINSNGDLKKFKYDSSIKIYLLNHENLN